MGVYRTLRTKSAIAPSLTRLTLPGTRAKRSARPKRRSLIVTTLKVPKSGGLPTTKVIVVRWLKHEGEAVKRGDAVVELQTEKVNYELDSPAEGILLKVLTQEGAEVPVGDAVCHIGQAGDAIPQH